MFKVCAGNYFFVFLIAIYCIFRLPNTNKNENFANGRMARNIYDDLVMNHARRVVSIDDVGREELSLLSDKDFVLSIQ
ncbi:hypothetical protein [Anoxynatronum sibiricum]|uniref:CbbX AAA lid domain-containing protein n=1 Tax=Anoxynatronum sibiricum TaxID=210623 RepID=A0ABU9VV20_9CLOT